MKFSRVTKNGRFDRLVKNCNARDCKNYGLEFCIDVCVKRNIDEKNNWVHVIIQINKDAVIKDEKVI